MDSTSYLSCHVMPFGLCNAPAMFQVLMNDVLRPFLHCLVLVFFDDILIYNNSLAEHLCHVCAVLTVLHQHWLFVKCSKCAFGVTPFPISGISPQPPGWPWIQRRSRLLLIGHSPAQCAQSVASLGLRATTASLSRNFEPLLLPDGATEEREFHLD